MTENLKRLYIFDMDGTLLPTSTGLVELAKVLQTETELQELEGLYRIGKLDTVHFTKEISKLWGSVDSAVAKRAFDQAEKIRGILAATDFIRRSGSKSCVLTMSQDIFANHFLAFGFDYVFATPYPPHNNFNFSDVLTPVDKVRLVEELCTALDLELGESIAFGDSISDVELFQNVKYSVSINGDAYISDLAYASYVGKDICEAVNLVHKKIGVYHD